MLDKLLLYLQNLELSSTTKEIALYLFGIFCILALGTIGYTVIEEWSVFDSLYMTVITLSTVGYSEVHILSTAGRMLTIVLIFMGVGVAMALLTTLAKTIVSQQVHWIFERKGMKTKIANLNNHIIICGYSRLSKIALNELSSKKIPVVIVEQDEEKVSEAEQAGLLYIHGDATKDEVLIEAGVEKASKVVSILPKDSDNLYVVLTVKELNPEIHIISRAEDLVGEKRLLKAGASKIISPYRAGGQKIADGLLRPYVTEFLDLATSTSSGDLFIEEILIPENSPLISKTISNSEIREKTNIIIAAIISKGGDMKYNPTASTEFSANDTLICMGYKQGFEDLGKIVVGN